MHVASTKKARTDSLDIHPKPDPACSPKPNCVKESPKRTRRGLLIMTIEAIEAAACNKK